MEFHNPLLFSTEASQASKEIIERQVFGSKYGCGHGGADLGHGA